MERKEKGVEREGKRAEGFIIEKLRGGFLVGKKGGPSTPPPTWRLEFTSLAHQQNDDDHSTANPIKEFLNFPTTAVSARKLCANLWEIEPHQYVPLTTHKMSNLNAKPRRRHPRHHVYDDLEIEQLRQLDDEPEPPPSSPYKPVLATLSRKHEAAPALQRGRSVERHGYSQKQPLSPACYSNSMEVAPYKPAVTPSSSLDFKGKMGENGYCLKTSTELLKVLNRIWSLEEQHASNMALVKAMKVELERSRATLKKLLQEKLSHRQEMDVLIKQITDERISKNKEQDNTKAAVQSLKDELEDERKLRKRSESLQRRLARELSEVKSSFSTALRDLERERKARVLLESLCDEFAKGIRDYDQEVRFLRQKPAKSQIGEESLNRLVLHISEAWLDERMQMNLAETGNDLADKNTVVDKLAFDIETFLQAKRSIDTKRESSFTAKSLKEVYYKRCSVESLPLMEAVSVPHNFADNENSVNAESLHYDQKGTVNGRHRKGSIRQDTDFAKNPEGKASSRSLFPEVDSQDITNYGGFLTLEGEIQENMVNSMVRDNCSLEGRAGLEMVENHSLSNDDKSAQDLPETQTRNCAAASSNLMFERVDMSHPFSPESGKLLTENKCARDSFVQSVITDNPGPALDSISEGTVSNLRKSKSFFNLPMGVKENTLMAKLLEARLDRYQSNSKPSRLMES